MMTIFGFVVVLGILIFVHELGHFIAARLLGVGVTKFSLGFGPRIAGFCWNKTQYMISAIPLGGYVKLVGESEDEEVPEEDLPFSFSEKPVWARMVIVAAGPFFNLLSAVLIFFAIFSTTGLIELLPVVGGVEKGGPAMAAGLQKGDTILSVDGKKVEAWHELSDLIAESGGRKISIEVMRDGKRLMLQVQPEKKTITTPDGENITRYMIGISADESAFRTIRLSLLDAAAESISRTWLVARMTVSGIAGVVSGELSPKNVGGPLFIAEVAGKQARAGLLPLASFIAVISISLGLLNLLPIPVLDGGHLMFFAIEAVTRKPVSMRVREAAQQVGIVILLFLMALAFYNDITRFFTANLNP